MEYWIDWARADLHKRLIDLCKKDLTLMSDQELCDFNGVQLAKEDRDALLKEIERRLKIKN